VRNAKTRESLIRSIIGNVVLRPIQCPAVLLALFAPSDEAIE
jgi:hypothetical protein